MILVLGISGNVSSGILRVLRKNFPCDKIVAACVNDTHSKIYCDEFVISPYAYDANFIKWIIDICLNLWFIAKYRKSQLTRRRYEKGLPYNSIILFFSVALNLLQKSNNTVITVPINCFISVNKFLFYRRD